MTAPVYTDIGTIPDGQDLAIRFGETPQVQRWTYTQGMFVGPDGQRLDPWFFTGLANEGRVMHGDFAPPTPREWFQYQRNPENWYLVLREEGEAGNTVAVGHWTKRAHRDDAEWAGFTTTTAAELLRTFRRQPRPEWASEALVTMTIYAREQEREAAKHRAMARTLRDVKTHLRYARDYANAAFEVLERTERNQ